MKGAEIHIGTVIKTDNGTYIIKSITEYPMETPAIKALDNQTYNAGDRVFYFLFDNGYGAVIGKAE